MTDTISKYDLLLHHHLGLVAALLRIGITTKCEDGTWTFNIQKKTLLPIASIDVRRYKQHGVGIDSHGNLTGVITQVGGFSKVIETPMTPEVHQLMSDLADAILSAPAKA